jgi:hypothetical protein
MATRLLYTTIDSGFSRNIQVFSKFHRSGKQSPHGGTIEGGENGTRFSAPAKDVPTKDNANGRKMDHEIDQILMTLGQIVQK